MSQLGIFNAQIAFLVTKTHVIFKKFWCFALYPRPTRSGGCAAHPSNMAQALVNRYSIISPFQDKFLAIYIPAAYPNVESRGQRCWNTVSLCVEIQSVYPIFGIVAPNPRC